MISPNAWGLGDTRTPAVRKQQTLWQRSGSLARLRANLTSIVFDTEPNAITVLSLSDAERRILLDARDVVERLQNRVTTAMRSTKTKYNLREAAKREAFNEEV